VSDDHFLSRWSRRKLASKATASAAAVAPAQAGAQSPATASAAAVVPAQAETQFPSPTDPAPLPPVESLTPESDFTPFMKAEVDPETKRKALKTLFQDPRFNVMDGLDTYIGDYSQPDPLPQGWLEKMNQFAHLGDRGQRDQEAAAAAAAEASQPPPLEEKVAQEQALAEPPAALVSDTSDAGSPPSELKES